MFAVYCPRHASRVLLGNSAVESVVNTSSGIVLHWRCLCGETGTLTTGRLDRPPSSPVEPTTAPPPAPAPISLVSLEPATAPSSRPSEPVRVAVPT